MNYLAIFIAALAAMAIGWAWYSPALFGAYWMKEAGMGELTPEKKAEGMKMMPKALIGGFLAQLVVAYVMTLFAQMFLAIDAMSAVQLAFWVWLGFAATTALHPVLWEKKSFGYYAVNAGYGLVSFIAIALIVVLWV